MGGRGAERLGLRGPIQRSQFAALLRNENSTTGKRLTARTNTRRQEDGEKVSNRQVGYGLVFGVPKSLSIYLAIGANDRSESRRRAQYSLAYSKRNDSKLFLSRHLERRFNPGVT
jgi:hypothetical protein